MEWEGKGIPPMEDSQSSQTQGLEGLRGKALWRALHREKVSCPSCGAYISRRALRWKHVCGKARALNLEAMRAKLDGKAVDGFRSRAELDGAPVKETNGDGGTAESSADPSS